MKKPSEASIRAAGGIEAANNSTYENSYWDDGRIIDEEFAPAIEALRWYGKNEAKRITTGSKARHALEDLGIPLEEE